MSTSPAPVRSPTESRALKLLGDGLSPDVVASACGVSTSRISQLLSDEEFSKDVAELRYKSLAAHTERDAKYDDLEDVLLKKLQGSLSMLFDPMKISKILSQINAAKRRGASTPDHLTEKAAVVHLTMPTQIIQQFIANQNNQIVKIDDQDLITVQSGNMSKLLEHSKKEKELQNVQNAIPATALPSPTGG